MKNDVFEQCYKFNMERKYFKSEVQNSMERTFCKIVNYYERKGVYSFDVHIKAMDYLFFIFWNNHPYWAFLLLEVYDDPDFLDCAKTVRKIAYTYRDLPTYTGLINYDMYQVAPSFC